MANKEVNIQPSTIETIDMALYDLIDSEFNLHTTTNSGWKKVPVLWISPERSFHVKNKEIRDKVGKLKLPLITVERSSLAKSSTFKGGWQANIPSDTGGPRGYKRHVRMISRKIAESTSRDVISAETKRNTGENHYPSASKKVVFEETYAPQPVWVTVSYSITLRTEYQQQMNDLITPFATKTGNINALLIEKEKHRYEAFIQENFAQSNNSANLGEEERMFQTKVDIKVLGYFLGDGKNDESPKIITKETIVEIKLIRERSIVGDEKPWKTDNKKYREF